MAGNGAAAASNPSPVQALGEGGNGPPAPAMAAQAKGESLGPRLSISSRGAFVNPSPIQPLSAGSTLSSSASIGEQNPTPSPWMELPHSTAGPGWQRPFREM